MSKNAIFLQVLFSVLITSFSYSATCPVGSEPDYSQTYYSDGQWCYDEACLSHSEYWNGQIIQNMPSNHAVSDGVYPEPMKQEVTPCVTPPSCPVGYHVVSTSTGFECWIDCNEGYVNNPDTGLCEIVEPTTCSYPLVLTDVNGTNQCLLPPNTNPDGTCEAGYSKDSTGTCLLDDDGDGVPNVEDDFPTDPTRTDDGRDGSNNDTNKDCSNYCGIDNPQDCMDSISLSSSRTPIAEVGYYDCSDCVFRVDEQFGLTCDEFFGQQAEEPLPEIDDCSHENSLLGFAFQSITAGNTECTLLIKAYAQDGKGFKSTLKNCSQGSTACFYNPKVADEEITDSNSSDGIDDTAIVQKLDEVKISIDDLNLPLNNIDDSVKQNTEILKESLDNNFNDLKTLNSKGFGDVEKSVTEGTNSIGTKIDSMNDNLGSKLNGITDAINSKETFPQESEGVLQYDDIEVDGMLGSSNSGLEAQFNAFTEGYATDLFSLQSVTLPVSPNCGCTDPSIDVVLAGHSFHQDVEVCSSLDSLFAVMRPLLWFAFLVTTLFGFFRKD